MNKKIILTIIITILCFIPGCSDSKPSSASEAYGQYKALYLKMAESLDIPEFKKIEDNTKIPFLIQVDREVSFGKRQYMTLDDTATNQSTQNRLVYLSNDQAYTVYIDHIFLGYSVESNLVYSNALSKTTLNNPVIRKFSQDILSFGNGLIRITVFSNGDKLIEPLFQNDIDKAVVKFLNDYAKKDGSK